MQHDIRTALESKLEILRVGEQLVDAAEMSTARRITLLFATATGTTETVAAEVVAAFAGDDRFEIDSHRMDTVDASIFCASNLLLILTSSTGRGDLPHNARAFAKAMWNERIDLSHIRYGMVGFGDRHYSATFGGGPSIFDWLMQELGAQRIGNMCLHDRQSATSPEEYVLEWLNEWVTLLD